MKPYVFPTRFSRGGWVVALEDPRGNALSFNSFPSRRIIFSGRRVFTEVPEFFFPLYILFANETSYKIFPPLFFTVLSVINASRIFEIEIIFLARMEIIDKFWTIEINSVRLEFLNDLCGRRTARKRWKIGEREGERDRKKKYLRVFVLSTYFTRFDGAKVYPVSYVAKVSRDFSVQPVYHS